LPEKQSTLIAEDNIVSLDGKRVQLGALDLGSNSFHLLVAQESNGRIQVLDKHKEMVRLAAGLDENNQLSKQACERALDCLDRFAQRLRPLETENVRVVGTNTLRKAQSKNFLKQAESILGHKIDIISGHEEARLIYLGVCQDLGTTEQRRLIVDIGGGSTELVLGQKLTPELLDSLYMGCVSMTQSCFANGKITNSNFTRAIEQALVELQPVTKQYIHKGWQVAVGTSGMINTVADVIAKEYDSTTITRELLEKLRQRLCEFDSMDAIDLDGLNEERKPVFAGGVAILTGIFQALGISEMTTSQSALREGLIFDLIGRQHHDDARDHTVEHLMNRFSVDHSQAREVRETAISLLSQVALNWNLTSPRTKHLLAWAADLLEIGMDISHRGYHKHGAYLIDNMDMPGFSDEDQTQISMLVRCHRRKLSRDGFSEDDIYLPRLTCLLRIAALLHRDRSHESLPHINAAADKEKLELLIPKKWLKNHPLTALDLDNEKVYLEAFNIELSVKTV
jgi:exopolyphosphatase/guanosine-5'-triphosphate,3'-diphosphate pyrophosphatase